MLDPGAGAGVLTAALVDRILALRATGTLPELRTVTLEAWELDPAFVPALRRNLSSFAAALKREGITTTMILKNESYIECAVRALDDGLFSGAEETSITHAILNPPYRKIATRSPERTLLNSVGMETSNLYAAFVWLAMRQLTEGGELSAITPRSFCNGPYFRDFRRDLIARSTFHRVHLFQSRTEAFSRDAVLQENILFHLSRGKLGTDTIMVSTGSLESPTEMQVSKDRFVSPDDPDQVIHIATDSDGNDIRDYIQGLPCRLEQLGLEVSTGPVVDFRLKDSLSRSLRATDVPLLYPHAVRGGRVLPPPRNADDGGDTRIGKKPVAVEINEETRRWLIPAARFVLRRKRRNDASSPACLTRKISRTD